MRTFTLPSTSSKCAFVSLHLRERRNSVSRIKVLSVLLIRIDCGCLSSSLWLDCYSDSYLKHVLWQAIRRSSVA